MSDPFSRSHAARRAKAEREARDTNPAKQEIQARIKAEAARREALAKPDPAYRPKLPMRLDVR
jgi:hypothetical protein